MREHWLVLGASSSIARAFARQAAARGALLTLAGRDLEDLQASAQDALLRGAPSARVLACDAVDAASRADCIADAGIPGTTLNVFLVISEMPEQADMDTDPALTSRMIEATYGGPVALLQGLAPQFELQRGGRPRIRALMIRSSIRAVCQRHQAIEWLPFGGTKCSCSSVPLRASASARWAKSSPRLMKSTVLMAGSSWPVGWTHHGKARMGGAQLPLRG